jgi:hypothetical protein
VWTPTWLISSGQRRSRTTRPDDCECSRASDTSRRNRSGITWPSPVNFELGGSGTETRRVVPPQSALKLRIKSSLSSCRGRRVRRWLTAFSSMMPALQVLLASETVLGVIVASTAVVHFAWGERGPGLALLLLAGPLWFAGAAVPGRCIRWVATAFASVEGPGGWADRDSSKRCPECHERIRLSARVCRFCGFRFDAGVECIERLPLDTRGPSAPRRSARTFADRVDTLEWRSERWRESA